MKDPLTHAEKAIAGFGQAEMRDLVAHVTGLAGGLPRTCGTWCGKRRPLAATSKVPEQVTCLPCREGAAAEHDRLAESGEALIPLLLCDPAGFGLSAHQADDRAVVIKTEAVRNRELAARYRDSGPSSGHETRR